MYKYVSFALTFSGLMMPAAFAGVTVTNPTSGSSSGSPVHFVASGTTSTCSKGVAAMGIYTAPYQKAYTVSGSHLDTYVSLGAGTYHTTVVAWDYCGGASTQDVTVTIGGNVLSNLQSKGGWKGYGELPPKYDICTSCGSGLGWSMNQGISSPSLDGKAAKFNIWGSVPYADILWNNHLIGHGTSLNMPDTNQTIVPNIHHLTYDTYFYGSNLTLAENIEFDIAQFFNGMGFMFGTECVTYNSSVWKIWDNAHAKWVSTNAPCNPISNKWNHVVLQFERTSDNQLLYKSITLNGVTTTLNVKYPHYSTPGWYGLVVNFQLDGNYKLNDYSVYLDKLNITYD